MFIIHNATHSFRQALLLPTTGQRNDGIVFDSTISSRMIWFEFSSGKIAGLTFRSQASFMSHGSIDKIAEYLSNVTPAEFSQKSKHIETLMNWLSCKLSSDFDLTEIANDLVRQEIRDSKVRNWQLLLTDESIRRRSEPYHDAFYQGIAQFNASLDQEALTLSGTSFTTGIPESVAYNYLFNPVSRFNTYRRQALLSAPLLSRLLSWPSAEFRVKRLQQSIDSGNPLIPVIADYFHCSKPLAKFLLGKKTEQIGAEWQNDLDRLTALLTLLKPGFWPVSGDDWHHFNQCLRPIYCEIIIKRESRWLPLLEGWLNDIAGKGYDQVMPRMERQQITVADIVNLPDFIKDLDVWVEQSGGDLHVIDDILKKYSVFRLAELSHRWHVWQTGQSYEQSAIHDSGSAWMTFIDEPWDVTCYHQQYRVVPLNTPVLLHDEGAELHHCVGGYTKNCRYHGSHIFSIRQLNTGKSLSTMEFQFLASNNNATDIRLVQHQGLRNSSPPDECKMIQHLFYQHVLKTPQDRLKKIKEQQAERFAKFEKNKKINEAWPVEMRESFRNLLNGFQALQYIGAPGNVCQ